MQQVTKVEAESKGEIRTDFRGTEIKTKSKEEDTQGTERKELS